MDEKLTSIFMQLFCEKNSDGTRNLRLKGRELWQRTGRRINDADMWKVACFMRENPNIIKLDLCYNNIGDPGIANFVKIYLRKENALEHLNLVGCNLGPNGMKSLHSAVSTMKLKSLRVNGNKIATSRVNVRNPSHLRVGASGHTTVVILDSTNARYRLPESSGVLKFHQIFFYPVPSSLGLAGNIWPTYNKELPAGTQYLAKILEENNTIEHLDIADSDQTLSSIPYVMSAIREDIGSNTALKVLDISRVIPSNEYYQYDPGHLSEQMGNMLKVNSVLAELHAQKCGFDGHDIELLLIGLSFNTTLLLLDLGYNRIGDHGLELLSKWLRTRPNLLGLNVSGNAIKDNGARALSFDMPFSKLRLLDISQNKITDCGMIDVLNSIKKPYMLRIFYIWGNSFTARTLKIIDRMLLSGVLEEENIDVKLYEVDGVLYHAYYPSDHYKHKYYCVMDHGCATELRIKRNVVEHKYAQPRHLVKFKFYPRVPAADYNLPPKEPPC